MIPILLHGKPYWFTGDQAELEHGEGAIAYPWHGDEQGQLTIAAGMFEESYAHLFEDGKIRRHLRVIGDRSDIQVDTKRLIIEGRRL